MLAGSGILSGSCGLVSDLNRDRREVLDMFDLEDQVKQAAHHCLFSNSDG